MLTRLGSIPVARITPNLIRPPAPFTPPHEHTDICCRSLKEKKTLRPLQERESWGIYTTGLPPDDLGSFSIQSYTGVWLLLQLAFLSILPVSMQMKHSTALYLCLRYGVAPWEAMCSSRFDYNLMSASFAFRLAAVVHILAGKGSPVLLAARSEADRVRFVALFPLSHSNQGLPLRSSARAWAG